MSTTKQREIMEYFKLEAVHLGLALENSRDF